MITNTQAVQAGLIASPLGNTSFNLAGNTFCSRDFNNVFTALPDTERYGFLGRANYAITPEWTAYLEAGYARVDTFSTFQEPFFAGTTVPPQSVTGNPSGYNINFAPGVAGNPFPTNARYQGVLTDMGTRNTDVKSDTGRQQAGLQWSVASWDLDSAIGYSKNKVDQVSQNGLSYTATSAVSGVPTTLQPPVPLSTNSAYNLDRYSLNTDAVRNQMRINSTRTSESTLAVIDTKASTDFNQWKLPGGSIGAALGMEYRRETMEDTPDPALASGQILGLGQTAVNGSRNEFAAFGELALPVLKSVEASLALR